MLEDGLVNEYFEWMYHLVCDDKNYKRHTYRKLLHFLNDIEFTYILRLDGNRAEDGRDFRYRFGYECGYSREDIARYLDDRPCSVLEMMMALAYRAEEQIMDDPSFGNRTGQWFWNMIVSLGLGSMFDSNFDPDYADEIIFRFLNRKYEPNGRGGLFTIENCHRDLRKEEIWVQFMWYLDDVIDGR